MKGTMDQVETKFVKKFQKFQVKLIQFFFYKLLKIIIPIFILHKFNELNPLIYLGS